MDDSSGVILRILRRRARRWRIAFVVLLVLVIVQWIWTAIIWL